MADGADTAPGAYSLEDKRRDAGRAFENAKRYHAELDEIYRYFTPFRKPTIEQAGSTGGKTAGAKRTTDLHDGTGPSAAYAFVSNMKADWLPTFEDFFTLRNGPLFEGDDATKRTRAEALQTVATAVHALTQRIRGTITDEMFADLFAGTGAMVINRGTRVQPIRGFAVPTAELAMENGPWGDVERRFWKRKWKARDIEPLWPNAKVPDGLAKCIRQDRNADIEITQYNYYDHRDDVWQHCVWTDKDHDKQLWTDRTQTSPWITPRIFVVPGEAMGRGLAHLGLPFVKTVNKARELALRAAAFALLGLWTRRHDGVFNPDTAIMQPGTMWKVGSNGGPLGPSIARLDVAKDFNISTVVINDEREQIRRVLLDDELPELTDRVRSPTEIAGRMRRYERNRGGATTRLAFELVTPLVQRSIDILAEMRLLPVDLKIDDILTQAVVTAPAAAAQKTDKVERMVSWLQMMAGLVGPQMMGLIAEVEKIMPQLARDLGIDEQYIRKGTQVEQLKALIDQAVRQALEANKGAEPAPPPPSPDEQAAGYVNGGM